MKLRTLNLRLILEFPSDKELFHKLVEACTASWQSLNLLPGTTYVLYEALKTKTTTPEFNLAAANLMKELGSHFQQSQGQSIPGWNLGRNSKGIFFVRLISKVGRHLTFSAKHTKNGLQLGIGFGFGGKGSRITFKQVLNHLRKAGFDDSFIKLEVSDLDGTLHKPVSLTSAYSLFT